MIKSSIEKLAEGIGYDIGMSGDVEQSNLINGLCEALQNSMDKNALEMQLCYVSKLLSKKSEKTILALAEFIKLKQNEN